MEKPDYELIKAVAAGDHRAFEHLVRKYQNSLPNFVCRYLGDRNTAEDIVQEVFLALYRTAYRFEARARVSTWLFRVAYNLSTNEIKRRQRNLKFKGAFHNPQPVDAGQSATDGIEAREREKDVMAALDPCCLRRKGPRCFSGGMKSSPMARSVRSCRSLLLVLNR